MGTAREEQRENIDADNGGKLEDMLQEIEDLIAHMEQDDISLDEAFEAYEQGMKKLRSCNERIDRIEKKMLVWNEQGKLEGF